MVTPAAVEPTTLPAVDAQTLTVEPSTAAPETTTQPPATAQPTTTTPEPTILRPDPTQLELSRLRNQLAQVEAERAAQATTARLTEEARQVQRDAIARGLSEEDANWMAQRHYALAHSVHQEREAVREQQAIMQGKINAAMTIGQEYAVAPSLLMNANSPDEMRAIGEREKRYAAQEARLKALEQARVQPQSLDRAGGSQAGAAVVSSDIDKLWVDYDRLHPGQPNPYDAQYRRFLGR